MELPRTGPEGLNTHAHSAHAQPSKFSVFTQTSLRRIASTAHLEIGAVTLLENTGYGINLRRPCCNKPRICSALNEVLPQSPLFDHTAKPKGIDKAQTVPTGRGCCLLDIQQTQELLSQSEIILKLLNDAVTFTRGDLQFPAVYDLHRASHVLYDSLFLQHARCHAHAGSVRAHHGRDEIVGDRK